MRSILKNKKGLSVGDIYPIILTIALVAILIAIVVYVLGAMTPALSTDTNSTSGEQGIMNNTGYQLAGVSNCGFNSLSSLSITNATSGNAIPSTNWTISSNYVVKNTTNSAADTNVNYSYSWKQGGRLGGASCQALGALNTSIYGFVPWLGIILLIVAAAIVLGILIRSLGSGGAEKRV
jgi:hypothetical protein